MFPTNSILVATDLSVRCEPALAAAAGLALRGGAQLHVLHAFELHANPYAYRPEAKNAFKELLQEARDGLDEQLKRTVLPRVQPDSINTEVYLPWKAIVQRARDVEAELIVLGPHDHVFGDRFLGTTSDRVVRYADSPTLIVRRELPAHTARVVLAIDGSPATAEAWRVAVEWVAALADRGAVELHIILSASEWIERTAGREVVEGAAHDAREFLEGTNVSVEGAVIADDEPAEAILTYVDRIDADLLVVSTTGHSVVDRWMNGSVTAELGATASCALLIVPTRDESPVEKGELFKWRLPMATL